MSNLTSVWILYANHPGMPGRVMGVFDSDISAKKYIESVDRILPESWTLKPGGYWICLNLPDHVLKKEGESKFYYSVESSPILSFSAKCDRFLIELGGYGEQRHESA